MNLSGENTKVFNSKVSLVPTLTFKFIFSRFLSLIVVVTVLSHYCAKDRKQNKIKPKIIFFIF